MSIIPVVLLSSYTFLARPRSMYICPRLIGHAASGHYLQVKLVGNLIHGHALVLHMVYPQVADDANLMCHCMDSSIEVLKTVRSAKGQPEYLPTNWRSQLDGVSTNWGSTSFAHHEYLHRLRVLGDVVDIVRNKVGSTHEDIDAVFGILKEHLRFKDCMTPFDLKRELEEALKTYALPVYIIDVDCVFDYKAFYSPHVDARLEGYGYSADTDG